MRDNKGTNMYKVNNWQFGNCNILIFAQIPYNPWVHGLLPKIASLFNVSVCYIISDQQSKPDSLFLLIHWSFNKNARKLSDDFFY